MKEYLMQCRLEAEEQEARKMESIEKLLVVIAGIATAALWIAGWMIW